MTSPYLVPAVLAVAVTASLARSARDFILWCAVSTLFSVVVPFVYVYWGVCSGRISDIHVRLREQRERPFAVALVGACVGIILLQLLGAPRPLIFLGVCYVVNGIVLALITLAWKISMHCAVFAACLTAAAIFYGKPALFLFFLLPAAAWARVQRGRHTLSQVIAGIPVSAAITAIVLKLLM